MGIRVAYLVPDLGAVSSTFLYREIGALRDQGVEVVTFSTRRPGADATTSAEARSYVDETFYLADYGVTQVLRCAALALARQPTRFVRVLATAIRDATCARVSSVADRPKILWQFLRACVLADLLLEHGLIHLHVHFAHAPASVGMYASLLTGGAFSFTTHANDLFQRGTALREKVRRATFVACISEYNRRFLIEQGCDADRLHVIRCGLDLTRFAWRDPAEDEGSCRLCTVCRLVEKKGIPVLVDALALLAGRGVPFSCDIVGEGPEFDAVRARIQNASLGGRVRLLGGQPQERVHEILAAAQIFVLPCVKSADGDMDGIPVALMEAMALGVPVVSTTLSGIPELIDSGNTGLLVEPGDAAALAEALRSLMVNSELRRNLARRARRSIEEGEFRLERSAAMLAGYFEKHTREEED